MRSNRIWLPAQTERLTMMNDGEQARSVQRGFRGREGVFFSEGKCFKRCEEVPLF